MHFLNSSYTYTYTTDSVTEFSEDEVDWRESARPQVRNHRYTSGETSAENGRDLARHAMSRESLRSMSIKRRRYILGIPVDKLTAEVFRVRLNLFLLEPISSTWLVYTPWHVSEWFNNNYLLTFLLTYLLTYLLT